MASNGGLKTFARVDRQIHVSNHVSSSSRSVTQNSGRAKVPSGKRSVTPNSRNHRLKEEDEDHGRVRVSVRLRPRNAEDILSDADFADCVELQPELKRLKLRKNNWSTEAYRFDEIFTETASQKRVYEGVGKPVVESVLDGYNGTIMAYGQTGTGKTFTVGRMGKDDASERGIMVRALEDILSNTSSASACVEVSYVQLYMESIQDLFAPENTNIPVSEDPRTGEVSVPGASIIKVRDLQHFLQLLQMGEANRHAANTKLNTESSRSHAILMVYLRKYVHEKMEHGITSQGKDSKTDLHNSNGVPVVRKSKLLIVDLAGSERLDKSGSEGHLLEEAKFINLSLTSLGKCINALAENSPHIPIRDSKLTRLVRDSFGGSARTSLIITIGPSARHHAETIGTIMFGQRAMKIVNMVKLKEEFDYESLCRKLENQVDSLTAEVEKQQKLSEQDKCELEKQLRECQYSCSESEKNLLSRSEILQKENARLELEMKDILDELSLQKNQNDVMHDKVKEIQMSLKQSKQQQLETSVYQNVLADTTQMYEKKIADLIKKLEDERFQSKITEEELSKMKERLSEHNSSSHMEISSHQKELADCIQIYEEKIAGLNVQLESQHARFEGAKEQLDLANKLLDDYENSMQRKEIDELKEELHDTYQMHEHTTIELQCLKTEYKNLLSEKVTLSEELQAMRQKLLFEEKQRKTIESELVKLKIARASESVFEDKKSFAKQSSGKGSSAIGSPLGLSKSNPFKGRTTIAKICEEVGLQKILQLLTSNDIDVQIHAVKVVANLAAEDTNQEAIVEEGGLDSLIMLLRSSQNTTILRVASGAIANLAMNEMNQGLIMSKGGAQLLADTVTKTDDPQTLRMVAGALANLCGNESLHSMLVDDGGIKALLGMVRSGSNEVIAQVARGLANFAKCESRAIIQGRRKGHSLIIDEGALGWLISNSTSVSTSTKRHMELALCHLAQNEGNAKDFLSSEGLKELKRISVESGTEDIRNLAKKILKSSPTFKAELHEQWL